MSFPRALVLLAAIPLATGYAARSTGAQRDAEPNAAQLAQSIQKRIETIHDFTADFSHAYEGGVLKKQVTERGRLMVKRPGKMRWEYTVPEAKTFVSDGFKMYSYIPADRQVVVSSVPPEDEATTPALFLAGKGSLARDFTATLADLPAGMPSGSRTLKLVPIRRQPDYDWLMLVVDPVMLAVRGLVTVDGQGGKSSFYFTNLKENVGLADKEFAFKIPRGVEIVGS